MNVRRHLARRYGSTAKEYRRWWAPVMIALSWPTLRRAPLGRGDRVLDLGCGVGAVSARVLRRIAPGSVIGVDSTEGMIRLARSVRAVVADAARVPLAHASADAVVSTFVLQHLSRPGAVVAEAARVLRPGGVLVTVTWGSESNEAGGPYDVVARVLERAGAGPDPLAAVRTWHERVDSPAKMRRYAIRAGLTVIEARSSFEEYAWTRESFLGWATSLGPFGRRLRTLPERDQARAVERIGRRLARLPDGAMVWRPQVVSLIARR